MCKLHTNIALLAAVLSVTSCTYSMPYCHEYPHWQNECNAPVLNRIEEMIATYRGSSQNKSVAFDWDGTLYNEKIPLTNRPTELRSGQSAFHQWSAEQIRQSHVHNLFPAFKTSTSFDQWAQNIQDHDDYLEGQTVEYPDVSDNQGDLPVAQPLNMAGYAKFSQITSFATGMTINDYFSAVDQYLTDYPVQTNAFTKTLDIMQRLQNASFNVWVITGSNPYFVATLIHRLDTKMGYNIMPQCSNYVDALLNHSTTFNANTFFSQCHIAGNADIVSANNKMTAVYDSRNNPMPRSDTHLNLAIVDHFGKSLAAQHIIQSTGPVVLYAGNSNGDYSLMTQLLNHQTGESGKVLGIFVQPNGDKLTSLLNDPVCSRNQCIKVDAVM